MARANKIKGGRLMVYISETEADVKTGNYVSIALATSHTLNISADTQDTSNKDEGGGNWSSSEASTLSWSLDTENMMALDGQGKNFDELFNFFANKKTLYIVFGERAGLDGDDVTDGGWTPDTTTANKSNYTGACQITALTVNAPNGEYANYTATFTGVGALKQIKNA